MSLIDDIRAPEWETRKQAYLVVANLISDALRDSQKTMWSDVMFNQLSSMRESYYRAFEAMDMTEKSVREGGK